MGEPRLECHLRHVPTWEDLLSTTAGSARATHVRAIAEHHRALRGPLRPILHNVVSEFGYVSREDVESIADVLNYSIADVHGVVTFYEDFPTEPPAPDPVRICRGEACQALGAQQLYDDAVAAGLNVHQVFCLGNCALGPSGTVKGTLHGRLDLAKVQKAATA